MKKYDDNFSSYHPLINFIYFFSVIVFSMFLMHPILVFISLTGGFIYSVYLKGRKAVKCNTFYMLPIVLILAVINPLVSHEGNTVIFYINGNAVTVEAFIYGMISAVMFISVLIWFTSYNVIMTSDKFTYLFGKIIPSTSLIITMILRFVPRFKRQIKIVAEGQRAIGRSVKDGNIFDRINHGINIISILTTWVLENSIETADSMKARAYGLKERSNFNYYKLTKRDFKILASILVLIAVIIIGLINGQGEIIFYPDIKIRKIDSFSIVFYISYLILMLIPFIVDVMEELKWKLLKYKI